MEVLQEHLSLPHGPVLQPSLHGYLNAVPGSWQDLTEQGVAYHSIPRERERGGVGVGCVGCGGGAGTDMTLPWQ